MRIIMPRALTNLYLPMLLIALSVEAFSQTALTWPEVRDKFIAVNPTLAAGRIGVAESRAQEITAYLRPNPEVTGTIDQINPFSSQPSGSGEGDGYRPFAFALPLSSASYLHERQHKRELRRDSAREATHLDVVVYDTEHAAVELHARSFADEFHRNL